MTDAWAAALRAAAVAAGVFAAVRCKGPLPDGTGINVDELTFGVVTDAAGADGKRSVAQRYGGNAGDADIDRIPFNML